MYIQYIFAISKCVTLHHCNWSGMYKYYYIIFLFFLISCSDDTATKEDVCDHYNSLSSILNSVIESQDYVTSFTENAEALTIIFHKRDTISVDLDCISNYNTNVTSVLSIDLGDDGRLSFPYLSFDIFSVSYNPLGWTPLSAALKLNYVDDGTITITTVKKNNDGINIVKTYEHNDINTDYPILGLYFNHSNKIIIEWSNTSTTITDTVTIKTTIQPDHIPEIKITTANIQAMESGMTLISYRAKENPSVPFMIDQTGEVRYILDYTGHPDLQYLNYDVGMERLRNGNFYFGHWPTNKLYEVDIFGHIANKWALNGYTFHHNVQEKENGNLLVTVNKNGSTHLSGALTLEDHIVELNRTSGIVANIWDLRESLDENRSVQSVNLNAEYIDWAHVNAVIEDPSDNTIIISCRKQGLVKLNAQNEVQWIMNNHFQWGENRKGENLNQFLLTPLDNSGNKITDPDILNGLKSHDDFEWNWFQHAPFVLEGDRLFCFDNGDRRNYNGMEKYSRAVEYIIDQENMTVQQVWSYGKERGRETYSNIVSDVDYLPEQNNILFAPGSGTDNGSGKLGGKIVELDYDSKEVVFEVSITAPHIVWHRVERMPLYPN